MIARHEPLPTFREQAGTSMMWLETLVATTQTVIRGVVGRNHGQ